MVQIRPPRGPGLLFRARFSIVDGMKDSALLPAPQEIRDWCSLLGQEMMHWPSVKMYHLFGTRAFYHRKVMFAMLPDERSLENSRTISYRTSSGDGKNQGEEWHTLELTGEGRVSAALASLEKAYKESILHPFPARSQRPKPYTGLEKAAPS
jgi:hypothetical protein